MSALKSAKALLVYTRFSN